MPWAEALNLGATELCCVKETYGNAAVYASSGWASAGVLHNAPT